MKGILFRATESVVGVASCLVLFGGVAAAQTIDTTGPDSTNVIKTSDERECTVRNDNDVTVVNNNPQTAVSGDAEAERNTSGGSVTSGDASNESSAEFEVVISNEGACAPVDKPNPVTPVTPTEVTPPVQPVGGGGRGAGEAQVTPVAQVVMPAGGVGAGSGGLASLSGLVAITLASGALAFARLQRHKKEQF